MDPDGAISTLTVCLSVAMGNSAPRLGSGIIAILFPVTQPS